MYSTVEKRLQVNKLSKTELMLLSAARERGGYYGLETAYGLGSRGGRISAGKRERDAMFKLETRGLIQITSRQPWQDYNNGYRSSGTVFSFKLTGI